MIETKHDAVTFTAPIAGSPVRIFLTLNGSWVTKGGLGADINSATVPASELAKLGGSLYNISGDIEFWYTNDPDSGEPADVKYELISIVDINRNEPGEIKGVVGLQTPDYEVHFADHRQGFAEPRGGRVLKGILNPDPLPDGVDLVTCQDLADMCLDAIGLATAAPSSMNTVDPPRDLHWLGSHAASELGKLLQDSGHVYCPGNAGVGNIAQIGQGDLPVIPIDRLELNLVQAMVDRRPTTQVYLTTPDAITLTYNADAESPPPWEFVAQDPTDGFKWKPLGSIASLGSDPADAVKKGFPDVDEKYRKKLGDQVYKCIRLKSTFATPLQSPLLRQVMLADGVVDKPHLVIEVAVQEKSAGAYVNRTVRLDAEACDATANVLTFKQRIGKVDKDERPDFDPYFTKITEDELKPTFSCEAWDKDAGQKKIGCYGFSLAGVTVSQLTEAQSRDLLTGYRPDVAVQCRSDIREVRINSEAAADGNYAACRAIAKKDATTAIRQAVDPRLVRVKGFFAAQISGRVSEIRIDPAGPRTELIIDGWTTASGGGTTKHAKAKCSAEPNGQNLDHPVKSATRTVSGSAHRSAEHRAANGATGARSALAKTSPDVPEPTGFRRVFAKATAAVDGVAGRWKGKTYSGKVNKNTAADFADTDLGTVSDTEDCIIISPTPPPIDTPIACDAGPVNDDGKLLLIHAGEGGPVFCKLTTNADGGEKYKAKRFKRNPAANVLSTGNLTEADFGTLSGTEDILFLNGEKTGAGHILTEGGRTPYAMGVALGYNKETPPLLVVAGFSLASGCGGS